MIKREHLDIVEGNFRPTLYLLDKHPGKYYNNENYTVIGDKELVMEIIKKFYNVENILNNYVSLDKDNCVLSTYSMGKSKLQVYLVYTEDFDLVKFYKDVIQSIEDKKDDTLPKFNLITIDGGRPHTITRNLKSKVEIDTDNSYNLTYPLSKVIENLDNNNSGLFLFTGVPGTGKSYLIKYLSQILPDKRFFYLSNNNLNLLSDPSFITYCINELEDSILILEDCELALQSREMNKSYDISNVLNLTDGILGDLINLKIIATLNTTDKLDTALLRKGRLTCKVDFKPLEIEQAVNLSKKLNKDIKITEPTELCKIYNSEDNNSVTDARKAVGFVLK